MLDLTTIRLAKPEDTTALAELHAEAWRYAYRGIIPGITLERMIARRGPIWWQAVCDSGDGALVLEFGGRLVGYAAFGRCRMRSEPPMGEIYELYVRPECHGAGFGRALFEEARQRLRARGLDGLLVWALAENELACRFYKARGGQPRFRTCESLGGVQLAKIGFHWR